MDRHVKWLRRRIIASVATQTAETFAVAAVLSFAVMYWCTDEGLLTGLFGAIVIGQLVAAARVGHAMRRNPLSYVFMRNHVDRPCSYRVTRFHGGETAHPVAARLPGFAPVATIRDEGADLATCFDVYHDPSRLVAASVSRPSGSVSLISSLADGRILVTDVRALPPHERLVMTLAAEDTIESLISAHRRAVSARNDVVELASSAHRVVLDSLAIEYDACTGLGPALTPFLDLERSGRRFGLRLVARIRPQELAELASLIGPDVERVGEPITADVPVVAFPTIEPVATALTLTPAPAPTRAEDPSAFVHLPVSLSRPASVLPHAAGEPVEVPSRPVTLAEAMPPAPDTAESLGDSSIEFWEPEPPAAQATGPGGMGSDLTAALGYDDESVASRPRLSAVLRANSAAGEAAAAERARRKTR